MKKPDWTILITDVAGGRVVAEHAGPVPVETLLRLGFARQGDEFVRPVLDKDDRFALIRDLVGINAAFVGGPGWSPAEVVAELREQNGIDLPFLEIVWLNPQSYRVRAR